MFLALLAVGCAELTTPPRAEPPVELAGRIAAQPLPLILNAAVLDFDGAGAALNGRPAATALAVARLEWMGAEFRPGGRLAQLPNSFMFGTQRAVAEGRNALGIAPDARPEAALAALLTAYRALRRGDEVAAQAALSGPVFTGQGRPVLSRLREPGAFPDAALATVAVRDEAALLVVEGRPDNRIGFDVPAFGASSMSLGFETGY
ncbi:hypothetical protein [Sediminicoccus sp. KRV36]|uniref:hypothetical protein n=1 Tax=Sediminicoccus sp. KRV36 TaxID=3133721 RepID=UPI00200D1A2B|nr:hypothetical protein [Sediminicoccus rosea]UPY38589.1 hypothetical protein LHU95_07800 [Sediminicoccus rosea]